MTSLPAKLGWVAGLSLVGLLGCTRPAAAPPAATAPSPPLSPPPLVLSSPTSEPTCVPDARFVEDVTVPDGTEVDSGAAVDKQWSVENSGSCDWTAGYRLSPFGDNPFVGDRSDQLYPARAGELALWRVQFTAPTEPGEYIGEWQAVSPAGRPFGDSVFLLLVVREP